jgi:hypothetical protein
MREIQQSKRSPKVEEKVHAHMRDLTEKELDAVAGGITIRKAGGDPNYYGY